MQLLATSRPKPSQSLGNGSSSIQLPSVLLLNMTLYDMEYRFSSLDQLSWLCHLPAPGATPASSLAGQHKNQKNPWLCVSTALQQ